MPPFALGEILLFSGFSSQRSIFAQALALSSTESVARLRLCSVPPPYETTGSEVPLIITAGSGRVGRQIIVFGIAAPTAAIAGIRSPNAQPTRMLMKPPSESPTAYTRDESTENLVPSWSSI